MEPQLFSCGLPSNLACTNDAPRASMEPQLFSCGLMFIVSLTKTAVSSLQWSRNFSVADWGRKSLCHNDVNEGFNGAATFQLRISEWIEPPFVKARAFNGAATFQLRIAIYWPWWNWSISDPSMEPQLFSCGLNIAVIIRIVMNIPSMEPQLFSCGLSNLPVIWIRSKSPSMEPQLFSCGLQLKILLITLTIYLQWSRNFSVADCRLQSYYQVDDFSVLQWSRNFSVADCIHGGLANCHSSPFNGAATFQLRIVAEIPPANDLILIPSMEPQLFSCGLKKKDL